MLAVSASAGVGLALIALTITLTGCASTDPARRDYVTTVRMVEKKSGGSHLSDQQLVKLGTAICHNLAAGRPRLQQVALADSQMGNAVAGDAVYFEAIHDFCPSRAGR